MTDRGRLSVFTKLAYAVGLGFLAAVLLGVIALQPG